MRVPFFPVAVAFGFFALGGSAIAQDATAHALDGGTRQTLESITIPPLQSAPFTAVVTTEWTRIMPDGSTGTTKNHRTVARDSLGRVFQERRYFSPDGDKQMTQISELDYQDPTQHQLLICHPQNRVCTSVPVRYADDGSVAEGGATAEWKRYGDAGGVGKEDDRQRRCGGFARSDDAEGRCDGE